MGREECFCVRMGCRIVGAGGGMDVVGTISFLALRVSSVGLIRHASSISQLPLADTAATTPCRRFSHAGRLVRRGMLTILESFRECRLLGCFAVWLF
jgi:hypothetical protein